MDTFRAFRIFETDGRSEGRLVEMALDEGGCIASSGLTAGVELNTTVLPFILRGVKLLGIDSVRCARERRLAVWERLATDMKLTHTDAIVREVTLDALPQAFATLLEGDARGRFVVKI